MINTALPFRSARQPIMARNIVSTSQPLAAQAGLAVFRRGGNAIDAALAAAITLTVVEPTQNGIGGDAFAQIWDGGQLHGLNASGRSPKVWTKDRFAGKSAMPLRGPDSVTVPGLVSGWVALSERFGALPFEDLFDDAIRHACDGYPVSPIIARQWTDQTPNLKVFPGFTEFLVQGRPPKPGEIWRNPAQAASLELIAKSRGEAFYRGELATQIAGFVQEHGGALSTSDLDAHAPQWVDPVRHEFREHHICEMPPNNQGIAALLALGILDHLDYEAHAAGSAQRMHLEIEAMRLAFADLYTHNSDPATMRVPVADLLDTKRLRSLANAINATQASVKSRVAPRSSGTVYLCTADKDGRMVSYIQSNYRGFGSGLVVPGTGIALQNRGAGFSLQPGHANEVAGSKLPSHTILPGFLFKNEEPVMAFGVMGANMQSQGHVQMVIHSVVEGLNPQASSDAPRWRIDDQGQLIVEALMPTECVQGMRAMGHDVKVMPADTLEFGSAQLVQRLPGDDIAYVAGSDHRRDGQAVGC
ncbi:gamma-glutamyltransferase [Rhodoferax koreense]|uniref:Gamma-glutamyltransferase n=1 Tax=Rhodoferax koreensis TaxID=1842727 RepID=A0A1P8JRI9_9BURK|nr:gamma-glutamyltransferase family protein [Rhodoferax koreense]APW36351.1 gamma-glutamyltransferase [Rhodoferax koreense]